MPARTRNHEDSEALPTASRTRFDPIHEKVETVEKAGKVEIATPVRTDIELAKLYKAMNKIDESNQIIEKVREVAKELGNNMIEVAIGPSLKRSSTSPLPVVWTI